MITTLSIGNCNPKNYDRIYLITKSISSLKKQNSDLLYDPEISKKVSQLECLAPSQDLYGKFLDWKNNKQWNQETFNNYYMPQFIFETRDNKSAQQWLNALADASHRQNIALLCFCKNKNLCHRLLVGYMLEDRHADIIIR